MKAWRRVRNVSCGLTVLLVGCSRSDVKAFNAVSEPMRAAETLEFLTIDPIDISTTEALATSDGAGILGRATLNQERFDVILDGLDAMVAAGDPKYAMACFSPGYALRETAPGGATILICLECSRVEYARDGKVSWSTLKKSVAPELDSYLSGLVKEQGLRTYMDPAP